MQLLNDLAWQPIHVVLHVLAAALPAFFFGGCPCCGGTLTACCDDDIPATLTATFADVFDCSCADGVMATLTYDSGTESWKGTADLSACTNWSSTEPVTLTVCEGTPSLCGLAICMELWIGPAAPTKCTGQPSGSCVSGGDTNDCSVGVGQLCQDGTAPQFDCDPFLSLHELAISGSCHCCDDTSPLPSQVNIEITE